MLEPPDLPDETLVACLRRDYGLDAAQVEFLPLGADVNTAVYRVTAADATPYFLKLRSGAFDSITVEIPWWLRRQGIEPIIAPIETSSGGLWTHLDRFAVSLAPFVAGRNGFEVALTVRQWSDLGAALKGLHTAPLPDPLEEHVPGETYPPHWRDLVRSCQARAETAAFDDPLAAELIEFLRAERDAIARLVDRAEQLARALQARPPEPVLCHGDIHAGNVLIDGAGTLYIVDWDTLILAPKERDLMFVGAGIGSTWHTPQEVAWFYQGYGRTEVDPVALVYYRYERIVQDIAAFCEQILASDLGAADRAQSLRFLTGCFQAGEVVDIAFRSERLLRG